MNIQIDLNSTLLTFYGTKNLEKNVSNREKKEEPDKKANSRKKWIGYRNRGKKRKKGS